MTAWGGRAGTAGLPRRGEGSTPRRSLPCARGRSPRQGDREGQGSGERVRPLASAVSLSRQRLQVSEAFGSPGYQPLRASAAPPPALAPAAASSSPPAALRALPFSPCCLFRRAVAPLPRLPSPSARTHAPPETRSL